MASGQWWGTNFSDFDKAREERASEWGPDRFWIPKPKPGLFNSKDIVFLSDDPFGFWEHDYKMNGKWGNHDVCISQIDGPCPMDVNKSDKLPISKYFIGLFSALDFSEWTNKEKKVIKYQRKVLAAKDKLAQKIRRHKEKRGSLIGVQFTLTRDAGDQTPSTGDDMEFVKDWKLPDLLAACKAHFNSQGAKSEFIEKFNLEPFDFPKLIKPRKRGELQHLVDAVRNGGGAPAGDGESGGRVEEDVPF